MQVELIYAADCPNVISTRNHLLKAFTKERLPARWIEWECNDPGAPDYVKHYGSPTILVNGDDVEGNDSLGYSHCRIYTDESGQNLKSPSADMIAKKLRSHAKKIPANKFTKWNFAASLPSIFTALFPKLICPFCWPAYAGILTSFGISFTGYYQYLMPVTVMFLGIALLSLGFRAQRRRGYWPFILGLIAVSVIIFGKFKFESQIALYTGVLLLLCSSFWNSWPKRHQKSCCDTPDKNKNCI